MGKDCSIKICEENIEVIEDKLKPLREIELQFHCEKELDHLRYIYESWLAGGSEPQNEIKDPNSGIQTYMYSYLWIWVWF